jgi:acyl carrier protein
LNHPLFERVQRVICAELNLQPEEVRWETDLLSQLQADSLDMVELIMALEAEFEVEVPDGQIQALRTVGDFVECIAKNLETE